MDQPDSPQFVTGHLSVWDEDGDEDEDEGVVQDVGAGDWGGGEGKVDGDWGDRAP